MVERRGLTSVGGREKRRKVAREEAGVKVVVVAGREEWEGVRLPRDHGNWR